MRPLTSFLDAIFIGSLLVVCSMVYYIVSTRKDNELNAYYPEGATNRKDAPYNFTPAQAAQWWIDDLPTDDEAIQNDLFHLANRYYSDEVEFERAVKLITARCGKAPATKAFDDADYEVCE